MFWKSLKNVKKKRTDFPASWLLAEQRFTMPPRISRLEIQHLGFYIDGSVEVLFTACTCVGEILCENGGEERFCSQRGVCVGV